MPESDGTALAEYLLELTSPSGRYKSPRQLSLRAGLNQSTVNNIIDRKQGDPESLIKLSEEIGVDVDYLFVKAGWLKPTDAVNDEEREVLQAYRKIGDEGRELIRAMLRGASRHVGRQRAQPRAAEASARYQAVRGPR